MKTYGIRALYIYKLFALIIAIIVLCFAIYVSFMSYDGQKVETKHYTKQEAIRIINILDRHMSFVEWALDFFANKIIDSYDYSHDSISFVLHDRTLLQNIIYWAAIYFIDNSYNVVASSKHPNNEVPDGKIEPEYRSWIKDARADPGKLHFSAPDFGIHVDEYIIPAGYGILDDEHYFIGYLATGIPITHLREEILNNLRQDIHFIIVYDNGTTVTASDEKIIKMGNGIPHRLINDSIHQSRSNAMEYETPYEIGDYKFTHCISSENYPFSILVGSSNTWLNDPYLSAKVLSYIVISVLLGLVVLVCSYQFVRPIIELEKFTRNIGSNTYSEKQYGNYKIHEFNVLFDHISKIHDITLDLKTQSADLKNANNQLNEMNEFIQSNISFLSHELKNPASNIIGFIRILKDKLNGRIDNQSYEYLGIIAQSAEHQDRQIDFFLRIFKFREYGKELENKKFSLKDVIAFNANMLRYYALQNSVTLQIDVDNNLPFMLGDPILIGHLIQNMISNGIKYNTNGAKLIISANITKNVAGKDELYIKFKDYGHGIKQSDIDVIFEKFNRLQDKSTEGVIGYGLGLAYVKTCISAHDGDMEIHSVPDQGTTFIIKFPHYRIHSTTDNQAEISSEEDEI